MAEDIKEDKKEEIVVPEKFAKIVKEIEDMKVVDLAELVKVLEKKFGVSAAAPVAMMAAPAANAAAGVEEKSEYDVILKTVGDKKIDVIKAVRDATAKGLKEAKDLVDAAAAEPQVIKEKAKKEEAEDVKKKFEAAGATIELK
ncbi:MAG: 50S ribosomal protein L7/L12 [Candidatus Parcubacteria bacterium]|nr:50S ribosomal protein L7/L12 [Candidatus Parcubacteria bacterium]